MRIVQAVGARPNFVKMAPVIDALARRERVEQLVVHTGQHYDRVLSDEIFEDLGLPRPDRFLGVGSGTHAEQTGRTLIEFERLLLEGEPPDLVVVGGDVNATLACALASAKLQIPVAHVESGLRSGDWSMPEEVNRVLTDRLSALLFTHSPEAIDNLISEGIPRERVHSVGNTMIDSLRRFERAARDRRTWERLGVGERGYVLVTLHRPSNVDNPIRLRAILEQLLALSRRTAVVFPTHPRTRAKVQRDPHLSSIAAEGLNLSPPVGYLDFLSLQAGAGAVLTDSGGVQEEATALGVPCYTLRTTTERPVTIARGTNELLGDDPESIARVQVRANATAPPTIPLWDGHAAERIAGVLTAPGAVTPATG